MSLTQKGMRSSLTYITKPAIQRIANKVGSKNVSCQVYDEMRNVLFTYLNNLMVAITAFTDSRKAATISIEDVQDAVYSIYDQLNMSLIFPNGLDAKLKACRLVFVKSRSYDAVLVMKKHSLALGTPQVMRKKSHENKMNIARAAFDRLAREVAQGIKSDSRFEKTALSLIQNLAEAYLMDFMEDAHHASLHANRTTLWAEDLQLARVFRGSRL